MTKHSIVSGLLDEHTPAIRCAHCHYDVRTQVLDRRLHLSKHIVCPECGAVLNDVELLDEVPFLFEGRTPLLAFFLVPIDLFLLVWPRIRLARNAPVAPRRRRYRKLITAGLATWLASAAVLFVLISILARVTLVGGCGFERMDPLSAAACAELTSYLVSQRHAIVHIGLFASAFVVATLVLGAALRYFAPTEMRSRCYDMDTHIARRVLYVMSPVFFVLVLAAVATLWYIDRQSGDCFDSAATPKDWFIWLIPVVFFIRLGRAGYADAQEEGINAYLLSGGVATMAWFVWIMALGEIISQRNLGHILRVLYLRG